MRSVSIAALGRGALASLGRVAAGVRDVDGAAAVELGILAPTLVLVLICTIDLGLALYRKMQVEEAAQAGAEYAVLHGMNASAVENAVTSATTYSQISASPAPGQSCGCATNSGVTAAQCGSTCSGGAAAGTYVTVSAQASYSTLLPYPLLPNSYTFTAQSTVRVQ